MKFEKRGHTHIHSHTCTHLWYHNSLFKSPDGDRLFFLCKCQHYLCEWYVTL